MTEARSNAVVLSIDLDEWFHCRWATGGPRSRWAEPKAVFQECFGSDRPRGDLEPAADWLLGQFAARRIQVTFFILGEVAEWYPQLVRRIAEAGHEVACHGMHHIDMSRQSRAEFAEDLRKAKAILEGITGKPVRGFRSPNLVVEPWLADVLREAGFRYDSSVCPSRGFSGKYSGMAGCPQWPYRTGARIQECGTTGLWEIPIPSFPVLRVPAATGIATRMFGAWWTLTALRWWLRKGDSQFYFHPYEAWNDVMPAGLPLKVRLLMRNRGMVMQHRAMTVVDAFPGRIVTAAALLDRLEGLDG